MLIGIDPGHGGNDPGAIGPTGLQEKTVTLIIAQKLVWYLQRAGLKTVITRDDDHFVALTRRAAIINSAGCDLALSVHCNASDNSNPGYVSTFIQGTGGKAEKLAKAIQKQMVGVGWPDGGIRVANLYMNRKTNMPSCLCEIGFISNPDEESHLATDDYQDKFAAAIARGVTDYITGV